MTQTLDLQLTAEEIRILASLIYEGVPRVWINGGWCCPLCLTLNAKALPQCGCGISREAAFVEAWMDESGDDEFAELVMAGAWIANAAAGPGSSNHRQPPPRAL